MSCPNSLPGCGIFLSDSSAEINGMEVNDVYPTTIFLQNSLLSLSNVYSTSVHTFIKAEKGNIQLKNLTLQNFINGIVGSELILDLLNIDANNRVTRMMIGRKEEDWSEGGEREEEDDEENDEKMEKDGRRKEGKEEEEERQEGKEEEREQRRRMAEEGREGGSFLECVDCGSVVGKEIRMKGVGGGEKGGGMKILRGGGFLLQNTSFLSCFAKEEGGAVYVEGPFEEQGRRRILKQTKEKEEGGRSSEGGVIEDLINSIKQKNGENNRKKNLNMTEREEVVEEEGTVDDLRWGTSVEKEDGGGGAVGRGRGGEREGKGEGEEEGEEGKGRKRGGGRGAAAFQRRGAAIGGKKLVITEGGPAQFVGRGTEGGGGEMEGAADRGRRLVEEKGRGVFQNCIFQGNKAKSGGGVFVRDALVKFEGGKMLSNQAEEDGGGLKWVGTKIEGYDTVIKSGNTAVYGTDEASFPVRLGMTRRSKEVTSERRLGEEKEKEGEGGRGGEETNEGRSRKEGRKRVLEVLWDSKRDGGEGRILNAGSGSLIPDDLIFYFMDEKGEIIRTIKDDYLKIEFLNAGEGVRRMSEARSHLETPFNSQEKKEKDKLDKTIRPSQDLPDLTTKTIRPQTLIENTKNPTGSVVIHNSSLKDPPDHLQPSSRTLSPSDYLIYTGSRQLLLGQTFQAINSSTSEFVITDLTVIAQPKSKLYLKVSVVKTEVKYGKGGREGNDWEGEGGYFFVVEVEMRGCLEGEVYTREENECRVCPVGKYSFHPVNSSVLPSTCLPCPTNAFCPGGSSIELYPNYWRSSNNSDQIYLCNLNSGGCLGGGWEEGAGRMVGGTGGGTVKGGGGMVIETVGGGGCKNGYEGNLCEGCVGEKSKNYLDRCEECAEVGGMVIYVLVIGAFLVGGGVGIIKVFWREEGSRRKEKQEIQKDNSCIEIATGLGRGKGGGEGGRGGRLEGVTPAEGEAANGEARVGGGGGARKKEEGNIGRMMEDKNLTRKRRLFILKILIAYLNMVFLSKCFNAWIWEWVRAAYGVFEAGSLIIRNMVDSSCLLKKMEVTENHQFSNLITGNLFGYALILVTIVYIRRRYRIEMKKGTVGIKGGGGRTGGKGGKGGKGGGGEVEVRGGGRGGGGVGEEEGGRGMGGNVERKVEGGVGREGGVGGVGGELGGGERGLEVRERGEKGGEVGGGGGRGGRKGGRGGGRGGGIGRIKIREGKGEEGEGGEGEVRGRGTNLVGVGKKIIEGMMTLCFVFKGSLLFLAFDVFNCIEIEGVSYLQSSPNYLCLTESHIFVIIFFSIPLLFILMVVFPLFWIFQIQRKSEYGKKKFIKKRKVGGGGEAARL